MSYCRVSFGTQFNPKIEDEKKSFWGYLNSLGRISTFFCDYCRFLAKTNSFLLGHRIYTWIDVMYFFRWTLFRCVMQSDTVGGEMWSILFLRRILLFVWTVMKEITPLRRVGGDTFLYLKRMHWTDYTLHYLQCILLEKHIMY